ncbi:MAG TPA: GntG family PLP-dependent aldolase [Flavobacteriales bacterium]|jgi:threonine aldolase
MIVDLRSDTITQPTPAMREAMFSAKVGDDVFAEDESVQELQQYAADMFAMEAALFCPSGTMTNQIAINLHTRPADEVICAADAHVYFNEGGGIAANSGSSVKLISGDRGRFTADEVVKHINADDPHYARTSLVCVENTMNRGGGCIYPFAELQRIAKVCKEHGLAFHCDGARLFNAMVEDGTTPQQHGALFDSISICLSKGLGAPVGSLLLGKKEFIHRAIRRRKSFGGGMRQAGFLAAAGLYALQHHVDRLKEDHVRAQIIGKALQQCSWVEDVLPVETNIVVFQVASGLKASDIVQRLAQKNVRCFAVGADRIRFVTHLDFHDEHLDALQQRLKEIV